MEHSADIKIPNSKLSLARQQVSVVTGDVTKLIRCNEIKEHVIDDLLGCRRRGGNCAPSFTKLAQHYASVGSTSILLRQP